MGKPQSPVRGYDAVLRTQVAVNQRTDGNADRYADHRRHLMSEIEALAPGGRLCLIGAGNCNDVDLAALAARFAEIHLVDLDREAVGRAIARQPEALRPRLLIHAPVDAGGLLRTVESWRANPPTLTVVQAAASVAVDALVSRLPGGFDAVASCCVLTQIGHGLTSILGPQHVTLSDAHVAAGTIHLRVLAGLLRSGGQALLVTDLVSSETYPLEELAPGRDLKSLVADLVRDGNFFKGVNPVALGRLLRRDPVLAQQAADVRSVEPWLWRAVQARTFLVNGLRFRRV